MGSLRAEAAEDTSMMEFVPREESTGESAASAVSDPTYELACLKRANEKAESLGQFVKNSRQMFLLQVRIVLKGKERNMGVSGIEPLLGPQVENSFRL